MQLGCPVSQPLAGTPARRSLRRAAAQHCCWTRWNKKQTRSLAPGRPRSRGPRCGRAGRSSSKIYAMIPAGRHRRAPTPSPSPRHPPENARFVDGGAGRRFRGGPSPPKRLQDGSGSRAAAGDSAQPAGRACAPRVKLWLPQLGDSSARVTRRVDPAAAAPRDCPFLGCRRKSFSLPLFFVGHGGWLGPFCRSSCSRVQMVWDHPDVFAACTVMAPLLPPCASGRGKLKQRDNSPRVQQEENPPHCTYSPSLPLSPT